MKEIWELSALSLQCFSKSKIIPNKMFVKRLFKTKPELRQLWWSK